MHGLSARGDAASSSGTARLLRSLLGAGLASLLLGLCVYRLMCVHAGPDPDTDAYGHFSIARQLLATPLELRIHWVWLPLYHLLLAGPVALGASLDQVREANALAAGLPPLLLLWALARPKHEAPGSPGSATPQLPSTPLSLVPLGAALLAAASPLLVQLGTTGQMEVCFCTLLMLAVALLTRERFGAAAAVLGALVLTRYEGWAVAAVVSAVLLGRRLFARTPLGAGGWACALGPGACVLAWAALRRLGGEPWFGFILDNQAFAERVLDGAHSETPSAVLPLLRYLVIVPWRSFGLAAACALLGVGPTLRREGIWLVAPGAAILAFLTLSSLTRSQLGLDRHFTSVVPFAATWIAHGLARLVAQLASALERLGAPARSRQGAAGLVLLAFALSMATRVSDSLGGWLAATRQALREPRAVAQFLRGTPAGAPIVCEDAAVVVLSGLAPERFVRAPLDAGFEARLGELSRSSDVYVVHRARNLRALASPDSLSRGLPTRGWLSHGALSYGALDGAPDALVVLRFATGQRR